MPCPNLSPTLMAWIFISSTFARKKKMRWPIIITHGWPGSIIEQLKIIDPLTNPTTHGGTASDAFDVRDPLTAGIWFSGKPTAVGWDPQHIARAWAVLMQRLGYTRYVAQGGDWGDAVTEQMAVQAPPGLIAVHTNMPAAVPPEIDKALQSGGPQPLRPRRRTSNTHTVSSTSSTNMVLPMLRR